MVLKSRFLSTPLHEDRLTRGDCEIYPIPNPPQMCYLNPLLLDGSEETDVLCKERRRSVWSSVERERLNEGMKRYKLVKIKGKKAQLEET